MIDKLSTMLPWGEAVIVSDTEHTRSAKVSNAFWDLWKTDKVAIKAAGIKISKPNGNWLAEWTYNPQNVQPFSADRVVPVKPRPTYSAEQIAIHGWFSAGPGSGNLTVEALAGTGKTFTIVSGLELAPEPMKLYVVFGSRNAEEASEKLAHQPSVVVSTFHALGNRIIKRFWPNAKPGDGDDVERDRVLEVSNSIPGEAVTQIVRLIGFAKNLCDTMPTVEDLVDIAQERNIEEIDNESGTFAHPLMAKIALKTLEASLVKRSDNRISFHDMIFIPILNNWVTPEFSFIVVDETQDMNWLQLLMALRLLLPDGRMGIVGDDNQAIYAFRGAASGGMALMTEKLNSKRLGLTVTYRCSKAVVREAQQYVEHYTAHPSNPEGEILRSNPDRMLSEVKQSDFILSRTNAPLMPVCLNLIRRGVPARIQGRDVGLTLSNIVKKTKASSVPNFLEKLDAWLKKQIQRAKCGKHAESRISYVTDQYETLRAVAEEATSVADISRKLETLFQNKGAGVVLSTVHRAKGLEAPNVFLLEYSFKIKPKTPEQEREERNIRYVGTTRARINLTYVEDKD